MITVEKKLNTFSKLVFEKEQKKANEKLEEIKRNNDKTLEQYRKRVLIQGEKIINKKIKDGELIKNQIISKAHSDVNQKILDKKSDLLMRLIHQIENKVKDFTKSQDYRAYLIKETVKTLENFPTTTKVNVYLTQQDIDGFSKEMMEVLSEMGWRTEDIIFVQAEEDIIGGLLVMNEDKTIRIDDTLATRIEDHRNLIGQMLYKELEEAGDMNG